MTAATSTRAQSDSQPGNCQTSGCRRHDRPVTVSDHFAAYCGFVASRAGVVAWTFIRSSGYPAAGWPDLPPSDRNSAGCRSRIGGIYAASALGGRVIALLRDEDPRTRSVVVVRSATLRSRREIRCPAAHRLRWPGGPRWRRRLRSCP
ncbi:MAG: hypothetical protein F6Q13_17025 [Mycobacterium sp.]|nr:MAG: hypothetical protein F6Q13_17025 [Mycobacterium sp.]